MAKATVCSLTSSTESSGGGAKPRGADADPVRILAGRVGRPHGLDGSFYVTGARPRLLLPGMRVEVGGRTLAIQRRGGVEQRPLLWLADVEDRDAALALRGQELRVAADQAPPLGEGEWWAHQLEGCEVHDRTQTIGRVARLIELPSCEALEVQRERQPPLLVPMVKDAIRDVDLRRRRIEIDLGFLGEQAR